MRLTSGRGQADVEELGLTLLKDSKFRLCSSCSSRGWEREKQEVPTYGTAAPANKRASVMELRCLGTLVADTQND